MDRNAIAAQQGRPRVLLVSYAFPPVGGAGVQRVAKFVKYLPQSGWDVSVLTAENPSVPVNDASLNVELLGSTLVRTAKTWEPRYATKQRVAGLSESRAAAPTVASKVLGTAGRWLLQPDPQILWYRNAVRAGMRLLKETPHRVIVASGPPFSAFLVGLALSRRHNLPLVLDYRDEWDLSRAYLEHRGRDAWSSTVQSALQSHVLRRASAIIATSQRSAQTLWGLCHAARSKAAVTCIYNGYDGEDFAGPVPPPPSGKRYRIAYVGTLWALTSAAPFVEAVLALERDHPALADSLEVVFAGRRTPEQDRVVRRLEGSRTRLLKCDYLAHSEAVSLMRSADTLCALLSDLPGASRVVPAKIFEYMAAQRSILAIAPEGELRDLVSGYPDATAIHPGDSARITAFLANRIARHARGESVRSVAHDVSAYERSAQARELAHLLQSASTVCSRPLVAAPAPS